ncbi:MAG TPA: hypothetical protein VJY85_10490, partial [Candidatus Limnocylindria bacterium]|nr:hypothetical protein [Candidatus Limnocylindria bacterium]
PNMFPSAADLKQQAVGAEITGTIDAYTDMYVRRGIPLDQARQMATDLYEDTHIRAGAAAPYRSLYLEYKDPQTGQLVQTMGSYDQSTRRYTDANGQPFPEGAIITRAQPASAMSGGALENQVARSHGWTKIDLVNDPAKQQQVNDEITDLMVERTGAVTRERGAANAANPLSGTGRVSTMRAMQKDYNTFNGPIRGMQMYLTNMASAYKDLKAGKMVAWEPFRTAFVRTSEAASVVMPSEFGRSGQIGSAMERIEGQIAQWMRGGGTLPDSLVDDMMKVGANMWTAAGTYDQQYRATVREQLKDPAMVGIQEEAIFGPPAERFNPWTIAAPDTVRQPGNVPPKPGATPTAQPEYYWDAATKQFRVKGT